MNETVYVVWLRTKPYTATKKINGIPVQTYWVNAVTSNELFTLKEKIAPSEYASGRRAKTVLISSRVDKIEIVR